MSTLGERRLQKEELLNVYLKLKTEFESICKCSVEYAGSVLRYKDLDTDKTFGDLDLIIVYDNGIHDSRLKEFIRNSYVVKRFGNKKATFLVDGVQVDLNASDPECVDALRMTCIGDSRFNLLVRAKAKRLNYKLNEYGLFDKITGNKIAVNQTEIFNILKIRYYAPSERSFVASNNYWLEKIK